MKKVIRTLNFRRAGNLWDRCLSKALFVLRTRRNAATGCTPAYAVFGHELPQSGEWNLENYRAQRRRDARVSKEERVRRILQRQQRYQEGYAPRQKPTPVILREGDEVMAKVLRPHKEGFVPAWTGPHQVVASRSEEVYAIQRGNQIVDFHIDDLRPAPREDQQLPSDADSRSSSSSRGSSSGSSAASLSDEEAREEDVAVDVRIRASSPRPGPSTAPDETRVQASTPEIPRARQPQQRRRRRARLIIVDDPGPEERTSTTISDVAPVS